VALHVDETGAGDKAGSVDDFGAVRGGTAAWGGECSHSVDGNAQVAMLALAAGPRNREGVCYSLGPDNDTGTPAALTDLLARIWRGETVSRAACDNMLEILLKQQLNDRLPRYLPPGTPCAHKTGTLPGIRNDSGIIYAGESAHVAVTVFSRWDDEAVSDDPIARSEQPIAVDTAFGRIGRLLYDTFSDA